MKNKRAENLLFWILIIMIFVVVILIFFVLLIYHPPTPGPKALGIEILPAPSG